MNFCSPVRIILVIQRRYNGWHGSRRILLFLNRLAIPAGVLFFFLGWFTMLHLVVAQTLIQLNTSREFIGRVVGLRTILASIVKITSALLTGVFISKLGVFNVFILFSLVILFSFLSIKKLSNVEVPDRL
ncbi:MFS transporter [Neobacillus terrae]|uniref:MFS transporter n=1 Tax=Neobacillus terrae TaxID=3034837 RepID=UPI00140C007F|nr:MFS transporter [Neobacillus terrae]NHM33024.1 MFS transporter [Neobacillus terrae]